MQVCSSLKSFIMIIAIVLSLISPSFTAHAQAPFDPNGFPDKAYQVKTSEELFRLPPEKQIAYLEGLQKLVVELEDIYPAGWHKPLPATEVSNYNLMIQTLIDKAYGATQGEFSRIVPSVSQARGGDVSVKCGLGLQPARVNGHAFACRRIGMYSKGCGAGFIAVSQRANGVFGCITNASFNKLPENDKIGLRAANKAAYANPNLAALNKAYAEKRTKYDSLPKPVAKSATSRVAKAHSKPKAVAPVKVAKGEKDSKLRKPATDKSVGAETTPEEATAPPAEEASEVAQTPLLGEAVNLKGIADADLDTTPITDEESAAFADMDKKCFAPTPENECSAETIDAAKRALYGTKKELCIYAGNFSYYRSGSMIPGDCQKPREFCYGFGSCRDKNWDLKAKVSSVVCQGNQVLCNPYLFSIRPDGRGYCVDPGPTATNQCLQQTSKDKADTDKPIVDRQRNHFLQRYTEQAGLTDTQRAGFAKGYDEFAANINKLCFANESEDKEGNIRKAYCIECNVIKRRMLRMNAQSIVRKGDDGCAALTALTVKKKDETAPSLERAPTQAPATSVK